MYSAVYVAPGYSRPVVVTVLTSGGQVTVEKPVGDAWVVSDVLDADGTYPMQLGFNETRFTPSGGAVFEVS